MGMDPEKEQEDQQMQTQENKKISFLNYNLYCLPWIAILFKPTSCPLPAERANSFLKHISAYDILTLQEVWAPRSGNIERYAKRQGYYVVQSSAPSTIRYLKLRVFGGGLMIISKYPIVASKEMYYDRGVGVDGFVTKGVLYAKIQVGSSFVHVFNTHLQASYGYEWDNNNPYADIRKKQIQRISPFINQMTKDDHYPIVLMGDFNVNAMNAPDDPSDSQEYTEMIRCLSGDLFSVVDVLKEMNKNTHPITYEGKGVHVGDRNAVGGQRLDFILEMRRKSAPAHTHNAQKFLRSGVVPFAVTDKIFTQISDHWGINAVLELFGVPDFSTPSSPLLLLRSVANSPIVSRPSSPVITTKEKEISSKKGSATNFVHALAFINSEGMAKS